MNPEELLAQVEKRRIAPVYFFSGDEEFLKEEAVRRLIAATIEPGMEDFSLDFLEGDASDAASIITLLSTIPMLAERRLVVVRNFQKLPQKDREAVVAFAEKPVPGASLVLITPKVDLKTTLYARLDKASVSVVFPPLYPDKIPGWLQQRARIYGKRISLDACAQIQTLVGDNPGELDSELEKLAVFVGNRPSIESVDVDAALATARAGDGFDLARAIGEKNLAGAVHAYSRAIENGAVPVAMIGILVRHLTILWKIRWMRNERRSEDDIKKTLNLGPGFNRHFAQYDSQSRLLSPHDLKTGFEAVLQADIMLKTSVRSPQLIMSQLLHTLCSGKQTGLKSYRP